MIETARIDDDEINILRSASVDEILRNNDIYMQVSIRNNSIDIGTRCRRSRRSMFGWPTGNDVSGHYKRHYFGTRVRRSSGRRSGVAVRAVDCWQ